MNKKLYALIALLSALCFFNSCASDDDNDTEIDEEWKSYNEQLVRNIAANSEYQAIVSATGNGTVYWKKSDVITNTMKSVKITEEGTPYFTDSVVCRYTAWYLDYDGNKVEFDSTEKNEQAGRAFYIKNFPKVTVTTSSGTYPTSSVPGCMDMLQAMKAGDEVEVCIPYQLGYGTYGGYGLYVYWIPGYTTLWFNIKLLKIIADNPDEFT